MTTRRVLLFGPYADAAGAPWIDVQCAAGAHVTAQDVHAAIAAQAPTLKPMLGAARVAVNHSFVGPDHPIGERDEVALIGMVSGG